MAETEALYLWAGVASGVAFVEFFWLMTNWHEPLPMPLPPVRQSAHAATPAR